MNIIDRIRPGIVAVLKPNEEPNGTGFFITSDGYILTCYHVIRPALKSQSPIRIQSQEGTFDAELIEELSCSNDSLDFAVLKVQADCKFPCLPLGTEVGHGDPWCTLGFELAGRYHGVPNDGTIKGYTPLSDDHNLRDIILKSDNPILPGLSGSPVFNMKTGRVVGIIKEEMDYAHQGHATSIEVVFRTWPALKTLNSESITLLQPLANFLPRYKYLSNIKERYKKIVKPWKKDIGSLPVSEVVQLELRNVEQKEESVNNETEQKETPRYSISDAINSYQKLFIIGDPGSGKSTSLRKMTYSYAEQILSTPESGLPVPIYLELIGYNSDIFELIVICFKDKDIDCSKDTILNWTKDGNFLFILDGFDELGKTQAVKCLKELKALIAESNQNKFVVASRENEFLRDFYELGFEIKKVEQLSDPMLTLFVRNYIGPSKGKDLIRHLRKNNLINEARNPLMLWFMILEYEEDNSEIAINKGVLFKNVIEHNFLRDWERKKIPDDLDSQKYKDLKVEILSKLAFCMINMDDLSKIDILTTEKIIDESLNEGRKDYKDVRTEILRQALASNILINLDDQLFFWHKSFRDYFAALELFKLYSGNTKGFLRKYADKKWIELILFFNKKWTEPLLFFIGLLEVPTEFVNLLVQPYFLGLIPCPLSQLTLAARCIGANRDIDVQTQNIVLDKLCTIIEKGRLDKGYAQYNSIDRAADAIEALGEMKSEKAGEALMKGFKENKVEHSFLDREFAKALKNVPLTDTAQESLLKIVLNHEDSMVREDARKVLRDNLSERTVLLIIDLISNKNESFGVRCDAILILCGYIGHELLYPEKVADSLIKIALEDDNENLRHKAVSALGFHYYSQNDRAKIRTLLINALQTSPDPRIRKNAAHALWCHPDSYVRKALTDALVDEYSEVRLEAAYILEYVGIETDDEEYNASKNLFSLFNDRDIKVRYWAIDAYGFIRTAPSKEELDEIIDLLNDEDQTIRYKSANVLGKLQRRGHLDLSTWGNILIALFERLSLESEALPKASIIGAIIQFAPIFYYFLRENEFEEHYVKLLGSKDVDERRITADVLRRIGTGISLPILQEMNADIEKWKGLDGKLFYAIVYLAEAFALYSQGKYAEAINAYDEALKNGPLHVSAWCNKGVALYNQCWYAKAIDAYDIAIGLNPNFAMAWNNKGVALKALGRTTEADAAFAKAKALGYKG